MRSTIIIIRILFLLVVMQINHTHIHIHTQLDPNRVLDIVLEQYEVNVHKSAHFIPVIKAYVTGQTSIASLIGFKFQSYHVCVHSFTMPYMWRLSLYNFIQKLTIVFILFINKSNECSAVA